MKQRIFSILVALVISMPASAGGGGGFAGATEPTQLLNNLELVGIGGQEADQLINQAQQLAHEVQMIQNQLSMYQNMLDNTANLSNFEWGQAYTNLQSLASIVQQGNAIAYSSANMDAQWAQRYQGYSNYLANTYGASNFRSDYQNWYTTQRDSVHGALKAANLQQQQFATEETTLNTLENMSETATGRMQAIKVGNQIAMQQVRQTQKLRELVMAQMQAQGNYMEAQAAKEAAVQARSERHFSAPTTTVTGNGQQYNPGTIITNP